MRLANGTAQAAGIGEQGAMDIRAAPVIYPVNA